MKNPLKAVLLVVALTMLAAPEVAQAYGGPGSVISGIGAFLAAVAAVLAALFGFIWFPLKRLYQKMTSENAPEDEAPAHSQSE